MTDKRIPLAEEEVEIGRQQQVTGTVRVDVSTRTIAQPVTTPLHSQHVRVERVPVGRMVDGPVPDRWEGDTLVISVLEEVAVVEKRLRVAEEVRITRVTTTTDYHADIPVRVEQADIHHQR